MPKLMKISVEVEEAAYGRVVNTLNAMPGVVKMDLHLGDGKKPPAASNKGGTRQRVLAALADGQRQTVEALAATTGASGAAVHSALYALRKAKLARNGKKTKDGRSLYGLTASGIKAAKGEQ